jgi:hypothetical protein
MNVSYVDISMLEMRNNIIPMVVAKWNPRKKNEGYLTRGVMKIKKVNMRRIPNCKNQSYRKESATKIMHLLKWREK